MSALLVITLLDYRREPNGRIHHVVAEMGARCDRLTVLHGSLAQPEGCRHRALQRSLTLWWRAERAGHRTDIRVWPLLNYPEGLGEGLVRGGRLAGGRLSCLRRLALEAVGLCGIVADMARMGSFLLAACVRAGGGYDAVLVQCPYGAAVGWLLRRLGRVRRLVYDDIDYAPGWHRSRLRKAMCAALERFAMTRADRIITCGRMLQELRRRDTGREVTWIPNGVDLPKWRSACVRVPHPPTLIYMGRIVAWSGVDCAVGALARIRMEIPRAQLLLVGRPDPVYQETLLSQIRRNGLDGAVRFAGEAPYDELPRYLAQADVGLAVFPPDPMKQFAFPLKVVEYMAAGLPVIASKGSETARLVQGTGAGLVVAYDGGAVAEAGLRLLQDPETYATCAERARRCGGDFGWAELMKRFHGVVFPPEALPRQAHGTAGG